MAYEENIKEEEASAARTVHFTSLLTYPLSLLKFISLPIAAIGTAVLPLFTFFKYRKKSPYVAHQALESTYLHVLLAALFFFVGYGIDESTQRTLSQLAKLSLYIGVGLYHLGTLGWSSISTSYGKDFHRIFSPFRSYYQKRKEKNKIDELFDSSSSEEKKEMFSNLIQNTDRKITELRELSKGIYDSTTKENLKTLMVSLDALWVELKKSPEDAFQSRHFLTYTVDTLVGIMGKYSQIQKSTDKDKILEANQKINPTIEAITKAVGEHHQKLIDKVTMNFDVEIEVLQKTIEMGGI
ncbi:MAG: 5-bromo-4-chloroindolyl phosphate hydrolysis family protein [Leptospiraceae bacterium]|nr:5-bromo-4-chloroindolyl phosphate hydrolysis family protein [Leptospiraceae bacterium]MCP5512891.1 5-bromo-4-chloroindolyl phosphate hydrolysis family protein [Leptospiraceae bacterium]